MLRRLLTCLALLTGFAVAGAPAQANMVEADIARVEAAFHQNDYTEVVAAATSHCAVRTGFALPEADRPVADFSAPLARTVHLRIDRSRE